jgi:hypothetical protein
MELSFHPEKQATRLLVTGSLSWKLLLCRLLPPLLVTRNVLVACTFNQSERITIPYLSVVYSMDTVA